MGSTWVIVNPAAGNGRAGREWPALAKALRGAGLDFVPCVTCGPGDGVLCARFALADGAETIVAVGGDGTLNEVVNGCLASGDRHVQVTGPTLALLPVGTGVDFARGLGIGRGTATIEAMRHGTVRSAGLLTARPVDLGRATFRDEAGREHQRLFVNVADFGLGPDTSRRVERGPKGLGGLAFLYGALSAIARYAPVVVRVEVDGETVYHGPSGLVAVANGRYFGGGMLAAPKARLDDGLFDILVLEGTTQRTLVGELLPRVYRGAHLRHPAVHLHRGAMVGVSAAGPFPLEVDGEVVGGTPAHFQLLPRALRVLAPAPAYPSHDRGRG